MQDNTIKNCTHNKGDFRFLYICHVKKFEINSLVGKILAFSTCFMYRNLKFLHMTDFFSTDTVRVSVTNMRYAKCVNCEMGGKYDLAGMWRGECAMCNENVYFAIKKSQKRIDEQLLKCCTQTC